MGLGLCKRDTPHKYRPPEDWPGALCLDCNYPEQAKMHYNAPKGWMPMELAPKNAKTVQLLLKTGATVRAHWAQDLSGESQPPFAGWFHTAPLRTPVMVEPVGWRPLAQTSESGSDD